MVQGAKVKRCPKCMSESLAAPLDFTEIGGRVILQDSQTYRGHQWYADTGEMVLPSPAAASPSATAKPSPAPRPSS